MDRAVSAATCEAVRVLRVPSDGEHEPIVSDNAPDVSTGRLAQVPELDHPVLEAGCKVVGVCRVDLHITDLGRAIVLIAMPWCTTPQADEYAGVSQSTLCTIGREDGCRHRIIKGASLPDLVASREGAGRVCFALVSNRLAVLDADVPKLDLGVLAR